MLARRHQHDKRMFYKRIVSIVKFYCRRLASSHNNSRKLLSTDRISIIYFSILIMHHDIIYFYAMSNTWVNIYGMLFFRKYFCDKFRQIAINFLLTSFKDYDCRVVSDATYQKNLGERKRRNASYLKFIT